LIGRAAQDLVRAVPDTYVAFRVAYTTAEPVPIGFPSLSSKEPAKSTSIEVSRPRLVQPQVVHTPTSSPVAREDGAAPAPDVPAGGVPAGEVSVGATQTPFPTPPTPPTPAPPDCPHARAQLTRPRIGEAIADQVQVEGSANIDDLGYYKFEFRREDVEDEWHWAASYEDPVDRGVLGTWQVAHLPEGTYTLRLTVVNVQGNYPFAPCDVTVHIRR
jgi:hypothetical protein